MGSITEVFGTSVRGPDGFLPGTILPGSGVPHSVDQRAAQVVGDVGGAGQNHIVNTPDLYEGEAAATLDAGFAIKNGIGDEALAARAQRALDDLNTELVYAGISLGVMTAQRMAQTQPGARGALLYEACVPITGKWAFGPWPENLPVQIHGMDDDEFFAHEGDIDAAQDLVTSLGPEHGELFTYPGNHHLFIDRSLPTYDAEATALTLDRSRALLDRVG